MTTLDKSPWKFAFIFLLGNVCSKTFIISDVWGRRLFLLLTVVCTCAPIPLMSISPWWFFALVSISGTFAVTFSIVFAYVADITDEEERRHVLQDINWQMSSETFIALGHFTWMFRPLRHLQKAIHFSDQLKHISLLRPNILPFWIKFSLIRERN